MFREEIDEKLLETALTKAMEYRLGRILPEMEAPRGFSRRHRRRMTAVFREACRPPRVNRVIFLGKRMSAVLVAALVASFGAVMLVEAWREAFFAFWREKFPDHSIVAYVQTGETTLPEELIKYAPAYIPEGYAKSYEHISNFSQNITYEDRTGNFIDFLQIRLDRASFMMDTETHDFETVTLSDGTLARYLANDGVNTILWENNAYAFLISGDLDKESLIKLADSTKVEI